MAGLIGSGGCGGSSSSSSVMSPAAHIHSIPGEVLETVFAFLDPLAALACERVCGRWKELLVGFWLRRLLRLEYHAQKFSLEAFGHLVRGEEYGPVWWAQMKRLITLESALDRVQHAPIPKKEYQFKLSNVGMASIGGRHVCGPYLLVINLVANTTPSPPSNSNNSPATSPTGGVHSPNDSYTTRDKFRWTVQSVNNSTSSVAGGSQGSSTGGGGSQMRKMSKSPSCIWQLNIYHIITGKLIKTVPNINMVQPCIAGCCFEDPTKDPSDGSSSGGGGGGGGSTNGGDRGDSSQQTNSFSSISASSSSTSSLFASILKRNSGNSSSRNKQFLNSKISAVVLFERDRATNQSKIVVVKAPLGNPNNIKDTSSSSSSPFSPLWGDMDNDDSDDGDCLTANEFLKRSMSDQSAAAAAAAMPGTTAPIGLREYFFSTEFKKSQSTIRVFDHLLVATFRHEEKAQTELQLHHILDCGHRLREWKRWTVPEQVWRVEFKDENVLALACRTKVLFFNHLHGSYHTVYSTSSHIPKTRLFIGMHHVMFASDYGSKPAVILPILNSDSVHVAGNLQLQTPSNPSTSSNNTTATNSANTTSSSSSLRPSSVKSLSNSFSAKLNIQCNSSSSGLAGASFSSSSTVPHQCGMGSGAGGGCGVMSHCEAVMIDSITWRDLSFKSASIGSTVLVDSPDENQFTLMNLDYPTVRLDYPHPNINTRECELCGISIVGHHLVVVLRNFKQNYCHIVKLNLLRPLQSNT